MVTPWVLCVGLLATAPGAPTTTDCGRCRCGPGPVVAAATAGYRLQPGDVLSVDLPGHPELTARRVVVSRDGTIRVALLVDEVQVAGMTAADAGASLTEKYRKYLVAPTVKVAVQPRQPDLVRLVGYAGVRVVPYTSGVHVVDFIQRWATNSGGADFSKLVVTHRDGKKQRLDLSSPVTRAGTSADILLQPGDIVYVPERIARYRVVGEVAKPGAFSWRECLTVLGALAAAGPAKDDADLAHPVLCHEGVKEPLDLDALLRRGDLKQDKRVEPGDVITVSKAPDRVLVVGEVACPGFHTLRSGERLAAALNEAKPLGTADLAYVTVVRAGAGAARATRQTIDATGLAVHPTSPANVLLRDGNVVYVAHRKGNSGDFWGFRGLGGLVYRRE